MLNLELTRDLETPVRCTINNRTGEKYIAVSDVVKVLLNDHEGIKNLLTQVGDNKNKDKVEAIQMYICQLTTAFTKLL